MVYTLDNIYIESVKDNPVITSKIIGSSNKWKQYVLREDIKVMLSNKKTLSIPSGFEWDLSSVPRVLWPLLPPNGDFIIGALIHDYLYQNVMFTRAFADKEMLLWSKAVNGTKKISLKKIDNYTRYIGVRLFGWTVWGKQKAK
jgi:hypothetical protein